MKKFITVLVAAAFVAGGSVSAIAADVVTYEAKNGAVTFDHKMHQEKVGECSKCHEGAPGKIEVDKDFAHKTCKGCHKDMNGPTKCNGCHKK